MRITGRNLLRSAHSQWRSAVVATVATLFSSLALAGASGLPDFDARQGSVAPSSQQLAMVSSLGANASWNKLGTPSSLIKYGDFLATGLSGPDAATVARNWVDANKALFRLSSVNSLQVISDDAFPWSEAYAVNFQQEVEGLRMAEDGLLTVGIVGNATNGWKIAYVSATTTGDTALSGDIAMTAADAMVKAARSVGVGIQLSDIVTSKTDNEWTTFAVSGISDVQRARMRALATPNKGVRPVYETIYLENANTVPRAYIHYIDAEDGTVWMRKDIVEQSHPTFEAFAGTLPDDLLGDGECADEGPWEVMSSEAVGTVTATVTADFVANDTTIAIIRGGVEVAAFDSGFSPEAVTYTPGDGGAGEYYVRVCDYGDGADWTITRGYTGTITFLEQEANAEGIPLPKWTVFPANANFADHPTPNADIRALWCWNAGDPFNPANPVNPDCDLEVGNIWSRAPWDYDVKAGVPTFTTRGNNAIAALSQISPLTPSVPYQPVAADRDYTPKDSSPWFNTWGKNKCNIAMSQADEDGSLGPDADEAIVNLFAMHNRMHDFSYALGFTEVRWNAQSSNFGNNPPGVLENDPVIGNAQAGGVGGGAPSYLGRDNANMITLPDGVSPITNMYLWQPLAGAFYAPCSDGDYDMAIIGHEYGHMIENRMIGKGDGRSGHHAGAMGESFGDLVGMEILNEYSFVPVNNENPFSVGGFATGNGERAIRNYNMSYPRTGGFPEAGFSTTGSGVWMGTQVNPLNFSNMDYDFVGQQVHANGEIWSATNFTVRQYLVNKYQLTHPYEDAAKQARCADGDVNPANCPGNRRWMQIVFDAMLLMPTATSMLEARDAYLSADQMRFGGANQAEIWLAFAHRGFGIGAASDNSTQNPVPDFASPLASNAEVTFNVVDENGVPVAADIFVGHYEARVSPIADTDGATNGLNLDAVADFAPGPYEFVARADGHGHFRFAQTFAAGESKTITVTMPTNHASSANFASASGDGEEHGALIDDTEETNWDEEAGGDAINVQQPQVTVNLGGSFTISRAQVSAMLNNQNRFTALREFKLQTSTDGTNFSDWITSGPNAFPGHTPRPVAPEVILREFTGPEVSATYVRIVALNNQCTGNSDFQDPTPGLMGEPDQSNGDHDDDPLNPTDCRDTSVGDGVGGPVSVPGGADEVLAPRHDEVHIAELQVFGAEGGVECTSGCDANQLPVAQDDSATTAENTPVNINVLADNGNGADSDPDGDALTVTSVSDPANGTAVNNGAGTVTYTPDTGFTGDDTFTYTISDGNGGTDTATVTVTVTGNGGGNNPPVAQDDSATTAENTPVNINVLADNGNGADSDPDGDALTVTSVSDPANGTAVNNGAGTVTYTPDTGFTGDDTFTYTISDGNGGTDTATVTVTVTGNGGGNNPPVARDDSATTAENTPVTIDVRADNGNGIDSDPDGDPISVDSATNGSNGTTVLNMDGTITYTPNTGYHGDDTFMYTISDNFGAEDTATVTVAVNAAECPNDHADSDSDSDSDDFDNDCIRDDADSDDDNDGDSDDSDSDDDNDGIKDDADSDDDNDGISDEFDQQSTHESQSSSYGSASAGANDSHSMNVKPNTLLVIALVETAADRSATVDIIDPNGIRVASVMSINGRALATAVPTMSGAYTTKVRNTSGAAMDYELTTIQRSAVQ